MENSNFKKRTQEFNGQGKNAGVIQYHFILSRVTTREKRGRE